MSGIAGLRGTGDWGTDERPKNFREGILRFNANGQAPIFALTSKAGKKTVDDPEFAWWNEGNVLTRVQINGALAASDTTIVINSADPTSTTLGANLGTATNLKQGDLLLVEPTTDNATYNHELVQVATVVSDTVFTVLRGVGGTTAATIANAQFLVVIGSAYAEGTPAPDAVSRNPIKFSNLTQIFKDTYELTGTADETNTRTNNGWSEDKKRKAFKHSSDIELAMLWGRKYETTGTNGKPLRYMGGLRSLVPTANVTVFGAATTTTSFLDAVAPLYTYNTGAGNQRIGFIGYTAATELGKIFNAATNVRLNNNDNLMEVYGLKFMRAVLPMGELFLRIHPLMSLHSLWKSSMFICDFDAIKYVALRNRDTKAKDDVQAKDEDVRRGFWQTECSLMLDYGGLTCGYLGKISAT